MDFTGVIFNHHSLPFLKKDQDIDAALEAFARTFCHLYKAGVSTVLVDPEHDFWGGLTIFDHETFGNWLVQRAAMYRKRGDSSMHDILSSVKRAMTVRNPKNEVDYKNWPCMGVCLCEEGMNKHEDSFVFMAAEKYDRMLISVVSCESWRKTELEVMYTWMDEGELIDRRKTVYNHTDRDSISTIKRALISNSIDVQTILDSWKYFFPKVTRVKTSSTNCGGFRAAPNIDLFSLICIRFQPAWNRRETRGA